MQIGRAITVQRMMGFDGRNAKGDYRLVGRMISMQLRGGRGAISVKHRMVVVREKGAVVILRCRSGVKLMVIWVVCGGGGTSRSEWWGGGERGHFGGWV